MEDLEELDGAFGGLAEKMKAFDEQLKALNAEKTRIETQKADLQNAIDEKIASFRAKLESSTSRRVTKQKDPSSPLRKKRKAIESGDYDDEESDAAVKQESGTEPNVTTEPKSLNKVETNDEPVRIFNSTGSREILRSAASVDDYLNRLEIELRSEPRYFSWDTEQRRPSAPQHGVSGTRLIDFGSAVEREHTAQPKSASSDRPAAKRPEATAHSPHRKQEGTGRADTAKSRDNSVKQVHFKDPSGLGDEPRTSAPRKSFVGRKALPNSDN